MVDVDIILLVNAPMANVLIWKIFSIQVIEVSNHVDIRSSQNGAHHVHDGNE
jgi:hypothetical protein